MLFHEPIPHKGMLNLYTLPETTAVEVQKRMGIPNNSSTNDIIAACLSILPPGPIDSRLLRQKS